MTYAPLALCCCLVASSLHSAAQSLTVMTYNIRVDLASDGADAWPQRRAGLAAMIRAVGPDVLGVQEALPRQVAYLDEELPEYAYVGTGRDDGGEGEHTALFYDERRLEVVESGTFWLSPTPERASRGWEAAYPRIATWARLRERGTIREFLAVNTHLDHVSELARREGLALIAKTVDTLAEPGLPVVLLGDFNAEPGDAALAPLAGQYVDVFDLSAAPPRGPRATFAGFDGGALRKRRRIDHVFLRGGARGRVRNAGTYPAQRPNGRYHSDHLPVIARVDLARAGAEGELPAIAADGPRRGGGYNVDYVESGSVGAGLGFSRSDGVNVFTVGADVLLRAGRHFAVGPGVAYATSPGVSGVAVGLTLRNYFSNGRPTEFFFDLGPAITFADGARGFSAAVAPGLSHTTSDGVRYTFGIGGVAYTRARATGSFRSDRVVEGFGLVFAPAFGLAYCFGRRDLD